MKFLSCTRCIALSVVVVMGASNALAGNNKTDHHAKKQSGHTVLERSKHAKSLVDSSPIRRIQRSRGGHKLPKRLGIAKTPAIDGVGNNPFFTDMNSTDSELRRMFRNDYADLRLEMAGSDRPNARIISNKVFRQSKSTKNTKGATDFVWQWGQFLDHDLSISESAVPAEAAPVQIKAGDRHFDPEGLGGMTLSFNRTIYHMDHSGVRQQLNEITGWIDASQIYGSNQERLNFLRAWDGDGRLKISANNLLPYNTAGLPNAGGPSPSLFVAGDVRANEQAGLTAMHTLFVREHNRLIDFYKDKYPTETGDELFERARRMVMAEMQSITYNEFLPVLLGKHAGRMGRYRYTPFRDASIANEFSTAAYRFGHSMLSPTLLRLNRKMKPIKAGHIPLRSAFFAPAQIEDHGIASLLRGLASQESQAIDTFVIDDVRNFLFGNPGQGGFDLVALNIQRGRDHGLPSYNAARIAMGMRPVTKFSQISKQPKVVRRLKRAYGSVDDIDLWVGGLAEDEYKDSMLGELFHKIIKRQFSLLKNGDRFFYEQSLSRGERAMLKKLTLAKIIRLNTPIKKELQDNVFLMRVRKP